MADVLEQGAVDSDQHVVQFYDDDADLVARVGEYLADGVGAGGIGIVIATGPHRAAFEARLRENGIDVAASAEAGRLISLDASATLARFAGDGRVDRDRFLDVVGGVVKAAAATGRPVHAYGEMVALLWEAGEVMAAIELEALWNELAREARFSLYCAYRSESVSGHEHADALAQVCHLHSAVVCAPPVEATWQFAPDAAAAREARRRVADALRKAGHHGRLLSDAQIVIAELAANAVRHARSPLSVSLRSTGSTVRLAVRDRSHVPPAVRADAGTATSGRGMRIVAALARRWGVEPAPDGKVVWAELGD